ncbi:MAG: PAAR domain-containing protein [Anaerolineae bacterium]
MSQPAARVSDLAGHGGSITGPGCPTVLIGGLPAARVGDLIVCPATSGPVPHVGGPILPPGSPTVLIGGQPAARVGDMTQCAAGPPGPIAGPGCTTVLIGP